MVEALRTNLKEYSSPQLPGQRLSSQNRSRAGRVPHLQLLHRRTCLHRKPLAAVLIGSFQRAHYFYREQFLTTFLVTQAVAFELSSSGRYKYGIRHTQPGMAGKNNPCGICVVEHRCEASSCPLDSGPPRGRGLRQSSAFFHSGTTLSGFTQRVPPVTTHNFFGCVPKHTTGKQRQVSAHFQKADHWKS